MLPCLPSRSLPLAAKHVSESGAYFYISQAQGQVTPNVSGPRDLRRQSQAPTAREPSLQGQPTFWGCSTLQLQWLCLGVPAAMILAAPLHVGLGSLCKTLFAHLLGLLCRSSAWEGQGL